MGLFSKLQNGDTVLKSLKFGNDRPGGGNSGQPYIKNPLIDEPGKLSRVDDDFLDLLFTLFPNAVHGAFFAF